MIKRNDNQITFRQTLFWEAKRKIYEITDIFKNHSRDYVSGWINFLLWEPLDDEFLLSGKGNFYLEIITGLSLIPNRIFYIILGISSN